MNELKVVLIGETGVGKSQLGNFILQKNSFKVGSHDRSETDDVSEENSIIGEMKVTLVDTPGLNDTEQRDHENMDKIFEKFKKDKSIDGIILVYSYTGCRRVQKHQELLNNLIEIFGKDVLEKRLKIIFTNCAIGDQRDKEDEEKERTQKEDTKKFLGFNIKDNEMIFVNTKKTNYKTFIPEIKNLLKQIYDIKRKFGSIENAKLQKENLKFIEEQKGMNLKDIIDSIYKYRNKISEINHKIGELKNAKAGAISGTVLSSILLPFTFGISSVGVAGSTIARNEINKEISDCENDLRYYRKELVKLEEIKEKLYKNIK